MTDFEDFVKSLQELVSSYTKNDVMLKIAVDRDSQIVRIFGENMTSVAKAKSGLEDVSELAYTTAEHHPYWGLLYNACQISKTVLEKWSATLTKEELDEIAWYVDELKNINGKLRERPDNDHED